MARPLVAYSPGHIIEGTIYKVVKVIGAGGMGIVYEVEDTTVGKRYVLKTLHANLRGREDLAARMDREARVLAKLAHRNIVEVITAGVTEDKYALQYFVMERLDGHTLRAVLRHMGPLSLNRSYTIGNDLFVALDHAHNQDVVHRDVKPENVFLCRGPEGRAFAKLLDFGIFTMAAPGQGTEPGIRFVGTYKYSSPEQLRAKEKLTPKSDVYSASLVLYEMIAGHHPFAEAEGDIAVAAAHIHTDPARLSVWADVPVALDELVQRGLSKRPEDRPDAFSFAATLRKLKKEWDALQPPDPAVRVTDRDEITHVAEATKGKSDRTEPDAPVFATHHTPAVAGDQLSETPASKTAGRVANLPIVAPVVRPPQHESDDHELFAFDPHAETESGPRVAAAPLSSANSLPVPSAPVSEVELYMHQEDAHALLGVQGVVAKSGSRSVSTSRSFGSSRSLAEIGGEGSTVRRERRARVGRVFVGAVGLSAVVVASSALFYWNATRGRSSSGADPSPSSSTSVPAKDERGSPRGVVSAEVQTAVAPSPNPDRNSARPSGSTAAVNSPAATQLEVSHRTSSPPTGRSSSSAASTSRALDASDGGKRDVKERPTALPARPGSGL